jgi:hypothetical protein
MDPKTWFIEVEIATCLVAAAMVAFALMVGCAVAKSLAGKWRALRNAEDCAAPVPFKSQTADTRISAGHQLGAAVSFRRG